MRQTLGKKTGIVFVSVLAFLLLSSLSACSQGPSAEDLQQINNLKTELINCREDIKATEEQIQGGGNLLVKKIAAIRLEILKTTAALLDQRILALETGAAIDVKVPASPSDPAMAQRLSQEIEKVKKEIEDLRNNPKFKKESLFGALEQANITTKEQTLTQLQMRYLAAKYGIPVIACVPPPVAKKEEAPTPPPITESSKTPTETATPKRKPAPVATSIPNLKKKLSLGVIKVELLDKNFFKKDFQEHIGIKLRFTAAGLDKPARAIKGIILFKDLFGETKQRVGLTITTPLNPGQTITKNTLSFKFNQFIDGDVWVRNTPIKDIKVEFMTKSILYENGSRRDF